MNETDAHAAHRPTSGQVVVSRELGADLEEAWTAWSDPAVLRQWWGPHGFTCPRAEVDLQAGGTTLVTMEAPGGAFAIHNAWRHTAVEEPSRLEFVSTFVDADGARIDPAAAGVPPTVPVEVPHVVELVPLPDRRTRVTVTELGYTDEETPSRSLGRSSASTRCRLCSAATGSRHAEGPPR